MFFAEETAAESWQTKRKHNIGSSQTQHKVPLNTNPWKPLIAQNFASAICSCHHSQAEFDLQLFCHLSEKATESYKQDKFSNIIFQTVCWNWRFFKARAEILALQDHHTNISYLPSEFCSLYSLFRCDLSNYFWLFHLFCFTSFLNPHKIFFLS